VIQKAPTKSQARGCTERALVQKYSLLSLNRFLGLGFGLESRFGLFLRALGCLDLLLDVRGGMMLMEKRVGGI